MNGFVAAWNVTGVVMEKRELTSPKSPTWRGYVVKVASLGLTAEVNITAEQHGQLNSGELVDLNGHLEDQNGRLKLVLDRIAKKPQAAVKSAGAIG